MLLRQTVDPADRGRSGYALRFLSVGPFGGEILRMPIRAERRAFWVLLVALWALFAAIPQRGPELSLVGAELENLVERGRLHFVQGEMIGPTRFLNSETRTESFRVLFNVFPAGDVFRVNHAPGLFFVAAPIYAASAALGLRFESHESAVWWILIMTLVAPLGALSVACLFLILSRWGVGRRTAFWSALAFGVASPWWAGSGILYQDSVAVSVLLVAAALLEGACDSGTRRAQAARGFAGFLLGLSVLTSYLVVPVAVGLIVFSVIRQRDPRARAALVLGALPPVVVLAGYHTLVFGAPWRTGYGEGGFSANYPSIGLANSLEKLHFYLTHPEYGLVFLFPLFVLGVYGLFRTRWPRRRLEAIGSLVLLHFLFILSIEHHGSVGYGIGRFFLPLFPLLALGLPAIMDYQGRRMFMLRALLVTSVIVSVFHAWAGAWYGLQGVMEPLLASMSQRLRLELPLLYPLLHLLAVILGLAVAARQRARTPSLTDWGEAS